MMGIRSQTLSVCGESEHRPYQGEENTFTDLAMVRGTCQGDDHRFCQCEWNKIADHANNEDKITDRFCQCEWNKITDFVTITDRFCQGDGDNLSHRLVMVNGIRSQTMSG